MSESSANSSTANWANPLLALHEQAGAELQNYGPIPIVSTFGQPQAEYAAIRKGCGLMDLPQRAIIDVAGPDRLSFLNNLLTNQLYDKQSKTGLQPGQGVYAFLLHARSGKIFADMNVWEQGDRTWLDVDARLAEAIAQQLERYHFAERVTIKIDSARHVLALHGPGSAAVLGHLLGTAVDLTPLTSRQETIADHPVVIARDDQVATPGYTLYIQRDQAQSIWQGLLDRFGQLAPDNRRAIRPIGWAAFNAARIEAGRPMFGIDFDDTMLPGETGLLDRAVSFTKGCYPGQEIVARMAARKQLARKIVGIRMSDDALPVAGASVHDEQDNIIGAVTSSSIAPVLSNAALCLAILKKPFFEIGSVVTIPAEGSRRRGVVSETPFFATKENAPEPE